MEAFCDNRLYYARGRQICSVELAPLHHGLVVRAVERGHPCYPGGLGLFATCDIAEGEVLGDYAGVFSLMGLFDTTPYTFEVNGCYGVDAFRHGNAMRFANDPRGLKCRTGPAVANMVADEVCIAAGNMSLWTVRFTTTGYVRAGSELLVDYGERYDMQLEAQPWRNEKKREREEEEEEEEESNLPPVGEDLTEDDPEARSLTVRAARRKYFELKQRAMAVSEANVAESVRLLRCIDSARYWDMPSFGDVRAQLHLALLVGLCRKRSMHDLGEEEEAELQRGLVTYDPGKKIRCNGPCGRKLPRSAFGPMLIKWRVLLFPPCNECK